MYEGFVHFEYLNKVNKSKVWVEKKSENLLLLESAQNEISDHLHYIKQFYQTL